MDMIRRYVVNNNSVSLTVICPTSQHYVRRTPSEEAGVKR